MLVQALRFARRPDECISTRAPRNYYERLVIIEHYDDRESNQSKLRREQSGRYEEFELVSFEPEALTGRLKNPDWKRITKHEAEQWAGSRLL